MSGEPARYCLAACVRFNILGLAVVSANGIVEAKRRCLYHGGSRQTVQDFATPAILNLANDYDISVVVVEPGSTVSRWCEVAGLQTAQLTIAEAKQVLLPGDASASHAVLFQHLVKTNSKLKNIVTILPATGNVAMTQRWRIAPLLAVALGLAAVQTGLYQHLLKH